VKKRVIKWIVILLIAVIIFVVVRPLLSGGTKTQYVQETVSAGTITTYFNFSGSMEVENAATVTASTEATVKEIYVDPNSSVNKNDRLMRLSDGTILKADIAGEVTSLNVIADSKVQPGDVLMEIMDMSSMKVTFKVDEYDVSAIQIGKKAQVTLDGSGYTFEGTISRLNKKATQSGDLSYYTTTIDLKGMSLPQDTLPGMQVTVKLMNKRAENVAMLKMDALSFTPQNEPYVLIRDGTGQKQVNVKVGINDGTNVEITEGLHSGDTVLYVPASTDDFRPMMGEPSYGQ
jgi:HlyD family secretion protein